MPKVRPSCFVLMPFGKRKDPARPRKGEIDFDRIYKLAIETGASKAGLQPVRADEETVGGIIHKPMLERLLLSDFAVADLTLPNPNVYYELGVRHSARQNTTLLIHASHVRLPFDVAPVRALPYEIGSDNKVSKKQLEALSDAIAKYGLTTTQQVGARLRAGTNCGSCLPEIRALLAKPTAAAV